MSEGLLSEGKEWGVIDRTESDPEAMFPEPDLSVPKCLQLTPGPLGFCSSQVRLPGLLFEFNSYGQALRFREQSPGSLFQFTFAYEAEDGPPVWLGHRLDAGDALLFPRGMEQHYLTRRGTRGMTFFLDEELVRDLGWRISKRTIGSVPTAALRSLIRVCHISANRLRTVVVSPIEVITCRNRVLEAFRVVFEPWLAPMSDAGDRYGQAHSSCFWLIKRVEAAVAEMNDRAIPSAGELAERFGASRRTLYRAFDEWAGMGVHEYLLAIRLNAFRSQLISGRPSSGCITRYAMDAGFTHLGRLSRYYRQYFGELPRETVRRRVER